MIITQVEKCEYSSVVKRLTHSPVPTPAPPSIHKCTLYFRKSTKENVEPAQQHLSKTSPHTGPGQCEKESELIPRIQQRKQIQVSLIR